MHSPALLDLGHGTVRHRDIAKEETNSDVPTKTKTGYFYHPKLDDYSEGQFSKVFKQFFDVR